MASNAISTGSVGEGSAVAVVARESEESRSESGMEIIVMGRGMVDGDDDDGPRTQAGPLPSKRGEIGFDETTHSQGSTASSTSSSDAPVLPERHPADRDRTPEPAPALSSPETQSASDASSTRSSGNRSLVKLLRPKKLPRICGVQLSTLGFFVTQILLLTGTIIAWVFAIERLPRVISSQGGGIGNNTTAIFIHVTFAIAVLMQLVFGERTIFRIRAERYAFKHPGQILPSSRRGQTGGGAMPFALAPWNRPPLPTYAAALALNGHGTGDVEDNIIAVPPPPAYGNTRGSTLLLSGLISDTLRAQRVRERVRDSYHSSRSTTRSSWRSEISLRPDRPVSYRSHDSAWEERLDAGRAMHLEETLARLEDGGAASRAPSRMNGRA